MKAEALAHPGHEDCQPGRLTQLLLTADSVRDEKVLACLLRAIGEGGLVRVELESGWLSSVRYEPVNPDRNT